jgi:undecaprenyl pyrophosphate phosphatase UppP
MLEATARAEFFLVVFFLFMPALYSAFKATVDLRSGRIAMSVWGYACAAISLVICVGFLVGGLSE